MLSDGVEETHAAYQILAISVKVVHASNQISCINVEVGVEVMGPCLYM
jgi:hypothetical protein